MFTLTLVDVEYETSVFFGDLKYFRSKMMILPSFHLATRINSKNANETEFINEQLHFKLVINIRNSNWHN